MAEYIEREAVIAKCKEIASCEWNHRASPVSWADAYEQFAEDVEEFPAADVVPVVRCKDCKHWNNACCGLGTGDCHVLERITFETFFCSYGERRDTNG